MAVLDETQSSGRAQKLLKTLKGIRDSGQSTQTVPHWPLTFPSTKQTQEEKITAVNIVNSIHDRIEGVAE